MIPTPDYGKLHESVYEPAEDTFLLLDALEDEADSLRAMRPTLCIEVGSGSGVVSTFLTSLLPPSSTLTICTDLNTHSLHATLHTASLSVPPISVNPLQTSLLDALLPRLKTIGVDVLIFNPPYVPTDEEELQLTQEQGSTGAAWAGGADGIVLLPPLLAALPDILAEGGRMYLVAVKANDPEGLIREYGGGGAGVWGKVIKQRRAGRESLFIIRFEKRGLA